MRYLAVSILVVLALASCGHGSTTTPSSQSSLAREPATALTPTSNAATSHAANTPTSTGSSPARSTTKASTPVAPASAKPAHIVVVVMENHSYDDIIGNASAPYINSLAGNGALFTQSFALTHPSEPNYVALFSGSTQDVRGDSCPNTIGAASLGSQLLDAGMTFTGYSESLPGVGYSGCSSGSYARKHSPWVNFSSLPASVNQPYTAFPANFSALPTVSFVIPNLDNDMHDGTVAQGDQWLQQHLASYAQWAFDNNSLLIVTWDEDDHSQNNQIATIISGAQVKPGRYSENLTHYRLLRTIEAREGLPALGEAAATSPVTDIWTR